MNPSIPKALSKSTPARRRGFKWDSLTPYLYLLPALLTIGVWVYVPVAQTLELSFYQWNLLPTAPKVFVGWENYAQLVSLPEVRQALWNTLIYTVGLLPLAVVIPLAVAILTENIQGRARNAYRVLIFVPMIMAPVVVSIIWRWLLNPLQGVFNLWLQGLGFGAINFLRDESWAIWTIIFITGWKLIGFSTLIFSAAIANVDRSYLEAARLDGASEWQIVRRVTLPLISSTVLFISMLTVLLSAQWSFVYINVLTQGGPRNATTNIYHLLWEYGFGSFAIGWSSAAAILLFVGFGLLAWGCLRLIRKYAVYET
ncbi:MAG: sugar ABC transporter permease [Meiothermus sp.]|nr:sugar ABC transporter permease [Meiothermus sp.]